MWEHYRVRFLAVSESEPIAQTGHFAFLARVLKTLSLEEVCHRIDRYFDDPPFRLRDGSRDFGRFLKAIDQLAGGSAPPPPERKPTIEPLTDEEMDLIWPNRHGGRNGRA